LSNSALPSLKSLLLSDIGRADLKLHFANLPSVALLQSVMFLLDTNIVSELRKIRPHGAVVAWIESVADADLHLSAVTLGEIQAGIEITRIRM